MRQEILQVLIIDDDQTVLTVHARLLRRSGASVNVASSGVEALALLCVRDFDLIYCDVRMPGIDGPSLLAEIRDSRNARFVFVTGHADYSREELIELGADAILEKPVRIDHFRRELEVARAQVRERVSASAAPRPLTLARRTRRAELRTLGRSAPKAMATE